MLNSTATVTKQHMLARSVERRIAAVQHCLEGKLCLGSGCAFCKPGNDELQTRLVQQLCLSGVQVCC